MNKNLSTKNMSIAPSVTLEITAKAKKMKADGEDVISFGAGEPDFKTPENIRRAAIKVIEEGSIGYTAASGLLELKEIAKIAVENNIYVISDEIYEKHIYEGEHISIASLGESIKELTIVVNGVSKCYAMTGWRIGYTAANREITKVMENIQSHATSNPNTIAQYASIEALNGDQSILEEMKKAFDERRNFMADSINSIEGLSCTKPAGAFYVMMNIKQIIGREIGGVKIGNSMDFANYLLDSAKVAVVPGIGFGSEGYVRLSYATSLENIMEGLERIEKAMNA